jgi:hypothetical protein
MLALTHVVPCETPEVPQGEESEMFWSQRIFAPFRIAPWFYILRCFQNTLDAERVFEAIQYSATLPG